MGEKAKYWMGFNYVAGIGPVRLNQLVKAFGDIEAAWKASRDELRAMGLNMNIIEELIEARNGVDLDREYDRLLAKGFELITWESNDYPERLLEIEYPPPVIYIWGTLEPADRWAVAIVGTRRMTAYGEMVTRELASALAANGITVVSGMARGIDGVAHRSALDANGRTIAVMGSGLDHIYPPEHRRLAEEIARNGAIITEYPLDTRPEGRNFPIRNRIISGLSLIVVITEAGEGSGALITAHFAAEQGREVFALPGNIYSKASYGTNRLILDGARPLLQVSDVLEALNLDTVARQEALSAFLPEDEVERLVYEKLSTEPIHVDELRAQCSLPVAMINASLTMLELKGRARQVGGMQYIRVHETRPIYRVD
jgi:DNA processing protein